MASSSTPGDMKSVGYAQEFMRVQCDLCDTDKDVTSYCTECVKDMCVKCKKTHDKLLIDHKTITVFEGRIIKHLNTKCQTHELVFSFNCKNCQKNICNKCISETHEKCNFVDISKHAEILKTPFLERLKKQKKHIPEIEKKSDNIKDHIMHFDNEIKNQISLIEKTTEKRHKDLDAQKLNLIKQLKSQQEAAHKTLHDLLQTLQNLKTSIDDITASSKTQIDLVPNAGVLQLVNESNAKLDSTTIKTIFDLPNPPTFAPSTLWDQGNNPLGSLQKVKNTTFTIDTLIEPHDTHVDLPNIKLSSPAPSALHSTPADPSPSLRREISVVRELSLGPPVISCTSDGSTCWVGLLGLPGLSYEVQLYNQRGDQLLSVNVSHGTDYTALTTTGDLLVSGYTTVISRVNKKGEVSQFTDISARGVVSVRGLVTTSQDDVFVCVGMKDKIKDKVVTFSARGKKISELNSNLFTSTTLCGIHAVSRDTFCVQDGWGQGGRLVFVDGGGQLVRHIDRTTTELQRDIKTLTGDRHGHLIIATGDSEYIHVLSGDGTCKRTYHIQGSGAVLGVSVGEDDVLWVGTWTEECTGKLIVAKYLE